MNFNDVLKENVAKYARMLAKAIPEVDVAAVYIDLSDPEKIVFGMGTIDSQGNIAFPPQAAHTFLVNLEEIRELMNYRDCSVYVPPPGICPCSG